MTIAFQLDGQEFMALNGGPHFKFTPAISLMVNCETQAEIDQYWDKLSEAGGTQQCGWLTDKFGVSWQIVPATLAQMMQDDQPEKAERVMKAVLEMEKLDLPTLERAYASKQALLSPCFARSTLAVTNRLPWLPCATSPRISACATFGRFFSRVTSSLALRARERKIWKVSWKAMRKPRSGSARISSFAQQGTGRSWLSRILFPMRQDGRPGASLSCF